MDRSLLLARLMGSIVAIALGMLINLGMYESMIAASHTGIVFYLSCLLSLLAGLAIVNLHNMWCAARSVRPSMEVARLRLRSR